MPDSYSADVAKSILQHGGNAIDAAIAAQFVLAVTLPEAGNIAGGGFMLVLKDGKSTFLGYRETAPASVF
jgi:gamma-glutamyltranspeptidase/glutathione hydrolase